MSLEELGRLVESGEDEESKLLAVNLLDDGVDPFLIFDTLTETMDRVGDQFAALDIFLPEVMLAGEALMAVVEIVRPRMPETEQRASKGKVVLGVARGDLHEIGKNIVKLMLEVNGFEVKDLGSDVDSLAFIKEAQAMGADFVGISSLMTTTMPGQQEVIEILKEKGIRETFKVIIGGAPTSLDWAELIGADLYCENAGVAPNLMTDLIKK